MKSKRLSDLMNLLFQAMRNGKGVILRDNEDRENEGDVLWPAQFITPEIINFMTKEARGLICLAMAPHLANKIGLVPMVARNTAQLSTNFTVSIEAKEGTTTGISAFDRALTIQTAVADSSTSLDFVSPGHIFPLVAKPGGVIEREGHTEAGVDLVTLSGLKAACVIVEIMAEDGTMAIGDELDAFAKKHGMPQASVHELRAYRMATEVLLTPDQQTKQSFNWGDQIFEIQSFQSCFEQTLKVHWVASSHQSTISRMAEVAFCPVSEIQGILGMNGANLDERLKWVGKSCDRHLLLSTGKSQSLFDQVAYAAYLMEARGHEAMTLVGLDESFHESLDLFKLNVHSGSSKFN